VPGQEVLHGTTNPQHRDPSMNASQDDTSRLATPSAPSDQPAGMEASSQRAVTLKSVLAGLLGITVIGLYSNTNDRVLKLSPLVGNHLPVAAFSMILLLAVLWNPLVGRWIRALRFGTKELALVMGMMLVCSWIPGSSFFRYFPYSIVTPWTTQNAHPQWKQEHTLDYLPAKLYPLRHDDASDPKRYPPGAPATVAQEKSYNKVYGDFTTGLSQGGKSVAISEVPYGAWAPISLYWGVLALVFGICLMAMIWMLHRQWAHHEQLSYPIASVATALIARTGARLTSDLFYSRLFWAGFVPIFCIHLINYFGAWFPDYVPKILLGMWIWDDHKAFPVLLHVPNDHLSAWNLYFSVIGLAYFIPSEISLSMGVSTIIATFVGVVVYVLTGTAPSGDDEHCVQAGSYLAYFCILVFTGRLYLRTMFTRALWLSKATGADATQTWAARLFLLAGALFVWCLVAFFHIDWFVAMLFAVTLMIYFMVFARVIAETGLPFLQADWSPGMTLCHLFGFPMIGPGATVVMFYLNGVLNPDARECVTPYVANSLKMFENVGARTSRLIMMGVVGMVVALVVGFGAVTYSIYSNGALDTFAAGRQPFILDQATTGLTSLRETGLQDLAVHTHGLAKLALIGKNVGHAEQLSWMCFGLIGVVLFSVLRFRFLWWPLHPVVCLMWGTWTANMMWTSFLIGWVVKHLIVRYGGGRTYQNLKPIFLGLIMGELFAVTVQLVAGFIYYMATKHIPQSSGIFPG
jgi:hypothetical protein